MSQIERNISVVVTGNSTGSANRPKAPPAAPVVATANLCSRLLGLSGAISDVRVVPTQRAQRNRQALAQRDLASRR